MLETIHGVVVPTATAVVPDGVADATGTERTDAELVDIATDEDALDAEPPETVGAEVFLKARYPKPTPIRMANMLQIKIRRNLFTPLI